MQNHLSDLLVSLVVVDDVTLSWYLGILVCLLFSFPLSHSLSEVRSVSRLAFRTITTEWADLLDLLSAGFWVNNKEILKSLFFCHPPVPYIFLGNIKKWAHQHQLTQMAHKAKTEFLQFEAVIRLFSDGGSNMNILFWGQDPQHQWVKSCPKP